MKASVGDLVYVASAGRSRAGVVTGLRHPDGTPPYVVRWLDTGAETLLFPRGRGLDDVRVVPRGVDAGSEQHRWAADIELVESGRVIHVVADLVADDGRAVGAVLDSDERAAGSVKDAESLAVAEVLERLAAELREGVADRASRDVDLREATDRTGAGSTRRA